ncbi:MAG: molybdenum cofactor guanylyltransferase [Bacteroidetes bacterium]|nr:molybdenum cofactor guanylyltransferase [Bacteroidota bacterium]
MGRPKALLPYGESTFIRTITDTMRLVLPHVIIIADDPALAGDTGLPVFADIHKHLGPLGGLHAALTHANGDMVFLAPVDTPLLTSDDCAQLLAAAPADVITVAGDGTRLHPLPGLYPRSVLPSLEKALLDGVRTFRHFIEGCPCGYHIHVMNTAAPRLANVNTPEDYASLPGLRGDINRDGDGVHPDDCS